MSDAQTASDAAYRRGRRAGLATAALALSIVAFFNLLGLEKTILAVVLAVLALRGGAPLSEVNRKVQVALLIAALHLLTIVIVLTVFHDKLLQLLQLLEKLG